jgi:hypothetical protein
MRYGRQADVWDLLASQPFVSGAPMSVRFTASAYAGYPCVLREKIKLIKDDVPLKYNYRVRLRLGLRIRSSLLAFKKRQSYSQCGAVRERDIYGMIVAVSMDVDHRWVTPPHRSPLGLTRRYLQRRVAGSHSGALRHGPGFTGMAMVSANPSATGCRRLRARPPKPPPSHAPRYAIQERSAASPPRA